MMFAPVYLDHNATTALDSRVLEAMLPFLGERFGNPSSRHEYGRAARAAVDEARQRVAAAVGAHPTEVVFTSGGSEANNLFLKGAAATRRPGVVAVSAIEHPCVREPALDLARQGWELVEIGVDAEGRVDIEDYARVLARRPALVSVMLANNETGVLQDIPTLAVQARALGAWFHTDAVQALGKLPLAFRSLGVNALTLSAHKIRGPKGAGALVLDKRVELRPLISGGGQERGLRSGTENVAAIVGFGAACELAVQEMEDHAKQMCALRERIEHGLAGEQVRIFSTGTRRLPNTTFFSVAGIDGETLVAKLDRAGFAVASGSACSSASPEPSRTLLAMGIPAEVARGAVRVSVGPGNTMEQADAFVAAFTRQVRALRGMTSMTA